MDIQTFKNISRIIERDSKATTYKFALLRGVIDIIQDDSPFIRIENGRVFIPLGLMIEKWLIYYYPLISSNEIIPQINGSAKLAFHEKMLPLIRYYNSYNGISGFYNDLRRDGISLEIRYDFNDLAKCLKNTISKMPMRYIGKSVTGNEYSIFNYSSSRLSLTTQRLDLKWLIESFGVFSIPVEYYEAFKILGSFISGTDSILFKWADFSVAASGKNLSTEKVLSEILKYPITEREILVSKSLYKSVLSLKGDVECVWTGARTEKYDIDHLVPFSIWKNNDLWNLLPVIPKVNAHKTNKIPSAAALEQSKDSIIHYWELISENYESRFFSEISIALLGENKYGNWQNKAFSQLKRTCHNLTNLRGYEEWTPQR